jgi:CheY-like chemotaxis protein/HPt (histidine-containing phosphotransfer) domain-containing protein
MKKNILVVEDNEISFRLAEYVLTQSGYQVEWACNGKECLEKIKHTRYAGILMDVHMPELDGVEATKRIRQILPKELLPIIGVTAEDERTELDVLIQAGMNGHLSKPYQIETLLAKVQSVIASCESTPSMCRDTNNPAEKKVTLETDWLDFSKILKQSQGDISLLKKTAPLFSGTSRKLLSDINQSLLTNDSAELQHHLHQLKGILGAFTTEGPFQTIVHLEKMVANNYMDEITALLPTLKQDIQALDELLQQNLL